MKKVKNKIVVGRNLIDPNQKLYFSETQQTLDDWTGGGYFKKVWSLNLFGYRLVVWKGR